MTQRSTLLQNVGSRVTANLVEGKAATPYRRIGVIMAWARWRVLYEVSPAPGGLVEVVGGRTSWRLRSVFGSSGSWRSC